MKYQFLKNLGTIINAGQTRVITLTGNIGDLFFENNIGRTDLPGGNKALLQVSINYVFENFVGFRIYPGHGESFILEENLIQKLTSIM